MLSVATSVHSAGGADLRLHFETPALADQVARFARELELRAEAGEKWSPGQLVELAGWPALVVAVARGLELHEQDLERPADAPSTYRPGIEQTARRAKEQLDIATAYGVASELRAPDYLQHLQVCPRYEAANGMYVLARSEPLDENQSGWVLQCGGMCRPRSERTPDRKHVDDDAWLSVPLFTFARHRPGLVRYLALPPGFLVRSDDLDEDVVVLRRFEHATVPPTSNAALLDLAFTDLWGSFQLTVVARAASAPSDDRVPLDFERDAYAWESRAAAVIVRERYGVSGAVASRSIAYARSLPVLRERLRWKYRVELLPEQFSEVSRILDDKPGDPKAPHAAAMRLREMTGRPFAPLFELVKRLAASREEIERRRPP